VAKGRLASIVMLDDKNLVFANCPVTDDAAVERTVDSGRYFVLRIQNAQGKHAFIGIAFNERNDAFDFNVALSEHKSECEREDRAKDLSSASEAPLSQLRDLSIKEGETIKIKLASGTVSSDVSFLITRRRRASLPQLLLLLYQGSRRNTPASSTSGPGKLLPPPGSKGFLAPPPGDVSPSAVNTVFKSIPATVAGPIGGSAFGRSVCNPCDSMYSIV
jgi:Protein of unknown function (DUF1681)